MPTQQEVEDFMAARKIVPETGVPLVWEISSPVSAVLHAPVEVRAVQVGHVVLVANTEFPQYWSFNLRWHDTEVYRLDTRPITRTPNHPNPWNRPEGFSKNVRGLVHEHVYFEGFGLKCARDVVCEPPTLHAAALDTFCAQARLTFETECPPPPHVQLRIGYV